MIYDIIITDTFYIVHLSTNIECIPLTVNAEVNYDYVNDGVSV